MGYNYNCSPYHWAVLDWEQIRLIMKQTGISNTLIFDLGLINHSGKRNACLGLNRVSNYETEEDPFSVVEKTEFKKGKSSSWQSTIVDAWQMLRNYLVWDLYTNWNNAVWVCLPLHIPKWNFCKSNPILYVHQVIPHLKESFLKLGNRCVWKYWIFC